MAITAQQVQELYIAYLGRPADKAGLDYWMAELNAEPAVLTLEDLRANFVNEQPEYANTYGGLSTAQIVAKIYENLFGREGEADGLAYWTGEVQNGNVPVDMLLVAFLNGASEADRAVVDQKVADAMAELPEEPTEPTEPGNQGETFRLTVEQDELTGTAGDDVFKAHVFDNQNTFQSGDAVNGGAGNDTLEITLGTSSEFAIAAETSGVEVISVRSQAANWAGNTGDNEVLQDRNVIDAQDMAGVREFWSTDSRADLVIEDVRVNSHVTTIGVRNTDPGQVDYAVYFDNQHITSEDASTAGSSLFLRLLDLDGMESNDQPLLNNPYNGFSFTVDGQRVVVQSDAIIEATSFAELVEAINAGIAANPALAGITASLGNVYTALNSATGNSHPGTEIVLSNNGSGVLGQGGWLTPNGEAPANTNVLARQSDVPPVSTDPLTSVDVVLDNVGRGSKAGDLEIGALSQSGWSASQGIQQFDVEVQRNSWINELRSTNNSLEVVNVQNAEGQSGDLQIDVLRDVRVFDASAMAGSVDLSATLSEGIKAKYLELGDTQSNPAAEDQTFAYSTGAGSDSVDLSLAASAFDNKVIGYADLALRIDTGAGNDNVDFSIVDGFGNLAFNDGVWDVNQASLRNITIETGAGDDTVTMNGAGNVIVNTGAGNDTVYADNAGQTAAFMLNADAAGLLAPVQAPAAIALLSVQVTYEGFGSIVVQVPSSNMRTSDLQINQAIKAAINTDPVLSKLLQAVDGPGRSLVVESLIDGNKAVTDLAVTLSLPANAAALTAADVTAYNTAYGLTGAAALDAAGVLAALNAQLATVQAKYTAAGATPEVFEQQEIDFAGVTGLAGDIQVGGVFVTLDGTETADVIAGKVAGALDGATVTGAAAPVVAVSAGSVVTVTFDGTSLDVADLVVTDVDTGIANLPAAGVQTVAYQAAALAASAGGTDSLFESNNTINVGAGNDVVVLGTGAASNDTLVFTGYNNGEVSVVNFEVAGAGADRLDFSAYGISNATAAVNGAAGQLTAGTVNTLQFTALDTDGDGKVDVTFDSLTAAQVLTALNGTAATAATTDLGNLVSTIDATAPAAGVSSNSYLLMVENAAAAGEYKVFHLESEATGANAGQFSSVQLVGVVDFGVDTDPVQANFA